MSQSMRMVYAQRIISAVLNFAQMIALARLLLPAEYGVALIVIIFTNYLAVLRDLGLSASAIQARTLDRSQQSALFWYNALITGVLALVIVMASPLIAAFYDRPAIKPMFAIAALSFFLAGVGMQHAASLKRDVVFWKVSLAETAGVILGFMVTIGAALMEWGAWSPILGLTVQNMITALGYFGFARWLPGAPRDLGRHFGLLHFGISTSVFTILNYSAYNIPTIFIGYLYGPEPIAIFSRAQSLFMFPLTFAIIPALQVLFPYLCRISDDRALTRDIYMRALAISSLVLLPTAIVVAALAPEIIHLLFGREWLDAAPILRWFCLALASFGMLGPFGQFMTSQGRITELRNWGIFDFALRGGAAIAGAFISPVASAAAFSIVSLALIAPASMVLCSRSGPISLRDQVRAVFVAVPSTLAAAAGVTLAHWLAPLVGIETPLPMIAFTSGAAIFLWLSVVLWFAPSRALLRRRRALAGA